MDLTPVAHNAIPSSYNQRQINAALSQLQALTNQYNTALSSFAQSFKSEVVGGNVYFFDLASLVCLLLFCFTVVRNVTGDRPSLVDDPGTDADLVLARAVDLAHQFGSRVRHHARYQDVFVGHQDVQQPEPVPVPRYPPPRHLGAQVRRFCFFLIGTTWSDRG